MGLSSIASKLVSAAIQAPRFFGALNIITRPHSTGDGKSLAQLAMELDLEGLAYNGREMLAGIDANGNIQPEWLKLTWKPVIVGDLITRGLQFTRKVIGEAVS